MNIIFIGDIVGRAGRQALKHFLANIDKNEHFIVINAENAAGGFGLTDKVYEEIIGYGANVLTGGNHIWDKPITEHDRLALPANISKSGEKSVIMSTFKGVQIAVLSLAGRVFMPNEANDPFISFDKIYEEIQPNTLVLVDFHAEATSEKGAFAWYVKGRAHAVFGTHTHIQTADEQLIGGQTFFISDVGACCSLESVLGMTVESSIARLMEQSKKMGVETKSPTKLNAVKLQIDEKSLAIVGFERINRTY